MIKKNIDATRCVESVHAEWGFDVHQCARKRGYGPDGKYCKQHAPSDGEEHGYVYTVYQNFDDKRPKVYRARIDKQGAKTMTISMVDGDYSSSLAFGCRRSVPCDAYPANAEVAIAKWRGQLKEKKKDAEETIAEIDSLLTMNVGNAWR